MKFPALSANAQGYAVLLGVGALVAVGLFLFAKKQVKDAAAAIANVNAGTPYEGAGVVGTLGNAADQASGGVLSSIGEAIGGWFFDVTHPAEPSTRKEAVADNYYDQGVLH